MQFVLQELTIVDGINISFPYSLRCNNKKKPIASVSAGSTTKGILSFFLSLAGMRKNAIYRDTSRRGKDEDGN